MSCGRFVPVTRGLVHPCDAPSGGHTTAGIPIFEVEVVNPGDAGPVIVIPDPPGSSLPPHLGGPTPGPNDCADFFQTEAGEIVVEDATLQPLDLGCPPVICLEPLEYAVGDAVLEDASGEPLILECL